MKIEQITTRNGWQPTSGLLTTLVVMLILTGQVLGQDWTRYRGDTQLRGRVALKSATKDQPTNFVEFQLGGGAIQPLLADLNGDGRAEVIYLRQGRLVAVGQDGTTLINNFFGATELVCAEDLDQDGSSAEIVAINTDRRLLMIINADGNLRWQYQFPETVTLAANYFKIADIAPERPGKELIAFPDHTKTQEDARGYFFTSTGQLYSSPIVPNLNGGQLNFPQLAIGDIEGNGSLQVVVGGRPRLMIYNGAGELKSQLDFREGDPEGRHYGLLTLADLNGDHTLEAVIVADDIPAASNNNKSMAITALQLTPTIKRIWGVSFPRQTLHAPFNAVVDLDGDGRSEVVVNLWTGSEQQIRVYRGDGDPVNLGQPLLLSSISGAFVWDIRDLTGDAQPELMASRETIENPSLSLNSELRIFRLTAQAANTLIYLDAVKPANGMYVLTRAPLMAAGSLQIGSSDSSRMKSTVFNETPIRFLTYSRNTINSTNIQERTVTVGANKFRIKTDFDTLRPGPVRAVLSSRPGSESFLINQEVDGQQTGELLIYTRKKEKLKLAAGAPVFTGSGFTTEVRVADLDNDGTNELLVRAASGRILILGYNEQLNTLTQLGTFAGNATPIIQTLESGKDRPQIITTANDNGRLRLVVYETQNVGNNGDLKVTERWGRTYPDISANTEVELSTGHFTGSARFDIFLATPRGLSMVVSSLDGSTIWSRTDIFTFGNHVSVRDTNRDGKDDIYIVANNLYQIVDGGLGTNLTASINVASLGGDFYSTPMLTGDNEVLLVGPGTVVKMLDQGKMLWNFAKTVNGKPAQRQNSRILMGVAELGNGGSFDRIGGNYGDNDSFYVYDYQTGLLSYKTSYQPITDIISADIDGDGSDEFIFGTADAEIVALHASDGSLLWSVKVASFPNDPVIAATGRDKLPTLIFAPGDGTIRMYRLNSSAVLARTLPNKR